MKVLFITRKWPPAVGGMELYSTELCEALSEIVDLDVLCLPGRPDGRPPHGLSLAFFMLASCIRLIARRKTYDVVHFGDLVLYPLAWWHSKIAKQKVRVISVFGLDLLYGNRTGLKPAIYRQFITWARRHPSVHHFIAISKNTVDIARRAGFEPVANVPLGIRNTASIRKTTGDDIEPYILFVGRLVRRKGAAWFADHVLPALPRGYTLHVAGPTWDASEGKALSENTRVVMHGRVSDEEIASLRARASVIIMPNIPSDNATDAEGFGLTALEAAASGTPLVASRLEGLIDAVADGKTGFLVEPDDQKAWIAKVTEILAWDSDQRKKFLRVAGETLDALYSWQRVAEDTASIYSAYYQPKDLHREPHAVLDAFSRNKKAQKIEAVLKRRRTLEGGHILDIGAGSGLIAGHFLDLVGSQGKVAAIDTTNQLKTGEIDFHQVTGTAIPFEADTFDFVISNHVIEHVGEEQDQIYHLAEISRVLKPGGLLYLAMPNRWAFMEPHFRLMFVSWFPRKFRTPWVRLFQGRETVYDCEPLSRCEVKNLLSASNLHAEDVTLEVLELMAGIEFTGVARWLVPGIARHAWPLCRPFIPTLVFLCRAEGKI